MNKANSDLTEPERKLIEEAFRTVVAGRAHNLDQYDLRAGRRRRAAQLLAAGGVPNTTPLVDEADAIEGDVSLAVALAGVNIVRRRVTEIVSGGKSFFTALLLIGGIAAFAVGSDFLSSERKDSITLAVDCHAALKGGALPRTIYCPPDPAASPPADAIKALLKSPRPLAAGGSETIVGGGPRSAWRIPGKITAGDEILVRARDAKVANVTLLETDAAGAVVVDERPTIRMATADPVLVLSWRTPQPGSAFLLIGPAHCPCSALAIRLSVRSPAHVVLQDLSQPSLVSNTRVPIHADTGAPGQPDERCLIERRTMLDPTWTTLRRVKVGPKGRCSGVVGSGRNHVQFRVQLVSAERSSAADTSPWMLVAPAT